MELFPTIDRFDGTEYRWLSNFYPSPITLPNGLLYPTVEHAYQAGKAQLNEEHDAIRKAKNPALAKKLGRSCQYIDNWEQIKDHHMLICVRLKFQIPELKEKLIMTSNAWLIEGNTWGDTYWGKVNGKGLNKLGQILMKVREEMK